MYVIDDTADEPIMLLTAQIGPDPDDPNADYVDGARFAAELLRLDTMDKKSIQVYINCPGGSVMDGMNIFNAMLKSTTPVDTHNIGIAASMGGVCFMGGRKRIMSDYASLMIHGPSGGDDQQALDSMRDSISTMLSAKSSLTKEDVSGLMSGETWLNSAECFAKGFATEIAVTSDHNKKRMPSQGARAMWKEAVKITNNLFPQTENKSMKLITAKLGLNDDAKEASVVTAIEKIQNDATVAITALQTSETQLKKDLKDAQDKVTALQTKVDAAEKELKDAKDATDAETATVTEGKAVTMVTAAVKIGKIKNKPDVIESWKKLAVADLVGTQKLIDEIPLNKEAAKIDTVATDGGDNADAIKSSGTAAGRMIAIANKTQKK